MVSWTQWTEYIVIGLLSVASLSQAQFPPPIDTATRITTQSSINPDITISYKSVPAGTCTTVFATQKQFTGYITLPPNASDPNQGNYTINTFFWFIESRQLPESSPFTIFINGGPGSSSMIGLFQEVGPCQVVEIAKDRLGTVARDWGWDRSSNIIFIDQPVQVGFSYDTPTNASLNLLDESTVTPPADVPATQPRYTFLNGTFASGNPSFTANTSEIAAQSIWHFLQTFLTSFPQYNTALRKQNTTPSAEVHLFTESFGGRYGPAMGSFFQTQNARRTTDIDFANRTIALSLVSLGIINGWIDLPTQIPYHPKFAYENTYGIEAISQLEQLNALSAYNGADGCQQLTATCRAQEAALDPLGTGDIDVVNEACSRAQLYCQTNVVGPYTQSGRSIYDISQNLLDPFPSPLYLEYLNQLSVQQAIGVPVNYTQDSTSVFKAFNTTGDYARDGMIQDLAQLLESGVRVALIYGDRDYICNWLGGEAVSFAIAGLVGASYLPWYAAGYAPIVANNSYIGGVVRQYGNLSFSRIYDAGHLVPAYQPETVFTVFSRIIQGTDISLGNPVDLSTYASSGEENSTHQNSAPPAAEPTCFLRAVEETCNTDQRNMLANGDGTIINGVLYEKKSDWQSPDPSIVTMAGVPGTAPASIIASAPVSHPTTDRASQSESPRSSQSKTSDSSSGKTATSRVKSTSALPTGVYTATGVPATTSSSSGDSGGSSNAASSTTKANNVLTSFPVFRDTRPGTATAVCVYIYVLGVLSQGLM
ncbi:Carboxypeptidase S1-like protein A [Exophiala dermatitidis]